MSTNIAENDEKIIQFHELRSSSSSTHEFDKKNVSIILQDLQKQTSCRWIYYSMH